MRFSNLLTLSLTLLASMQLAAAEHDAHAAPPPPGTQAPAVLHVDAPLPALLQRGAVVVLFRAENVQVAPVYGDAAAKVVPRLGHLHLTLDAAPWHWVHAGTDPIVLQHLPSGRHQLKLDLADAGHRVIASKTLEFNVP